VRKERDNSVLLWHLGNILSNFLYVTINSVYAMPKVITTNRCACNSHDAHSFHHWLNVDRCIGRLLNNNFSTKTNYSKDDPRHHCVRHSYKAQKCLILRQSNKNELLAQNKMQLQSKVGMLVARFPQCNLWSGSHAGVCSQFLIYFKFSYII